MLSKTIVKKKLEKLGDLYNRVKSRLPADFSFEYKNDNYKKLNIGRIGDLEGNIKDIEYSIRMLCNKDHMIIWINYFNGAYQALKKYEKKGKQNEKH
ncbi:hypothetical protein LCGC14_2951630 [marine sediment metagenome]|uniref:Uncharacterized protein n=1 Tax=marine sediment metagenome TaxID=412755 RepID=A0A0F8XFM9_9ZZZZ